MKLSRQKIIAIACALFLQLGLFASSVHAADHPFHVHDDLCAAFISFAKHDIGLDSPAPAIVVSSFSVVTAAESQQYLFTRLRQAYLSRAPPTHR